MFSKQFVYDILERVLKTGLAAVLAYVALKLGVDPTGSDAGSMIANTTGLTALLNLVTGRIGDKGTGSLLPVAAEEDAA